jgi:hypothetical protein
MINRAVRFRLCCWAMVNADIKADGAAEPFIF